MNFVIVRYISRQAKASKLKNLFNSQFTPLNSPSLLPHSPMAADRPYQSHLLSFLNRQLQTAKDKTGIIWRTVKLSVSTALAIGVQAVMYPIYAVIKATELVGKQIQASSDDITKWLRSGKSNPTSSLVHLTSDAPLISVLTALTQRQIADTTVGTADALTVALASGLTIQGIASRLSDRRVALVTSDQQVLDLLSDSQEAQLQHRIRYEIAMYLRWIRSRTLQPSSLEISTTDDRTSWISSFWTRIFWIQRVWGNSKQDIKLPSTAQLKLPPITIPTLWTTASSSLGFFSLPNLQELPSLQELPNLIQAALRYFFGSSRKYYIRGENQTLLSEESWFNFEMLWGTPTIAVFQAPNLQVLKLQAPNSDRTIPSPTTLITLISGSIPISTNRLVKPRIISRSPAPIAFNKPSSAQGQDNTSSQKNLVKKTAAGTKHSPDWLEAKSVGLGYNKNWADRCIGWLDWVLVKIEQTFLTIWQALVTLFQSR
jgi:hypothetical protein